MKTYKSNPIFLHYDPVDMCPVRNAGWYWSVGHYPTNCSDYKEEVVENKKDEQEVMIMISGGYQWSAHIKEGIR